VSPRTILDSVLKRVNLSKLSRREKFIVAGGACALVVFLLIQLVITPVFSHRTQMRQAVKSKTLMLAEMHRMKSDYDGLKSRSRQSEARFTRRDKGFTLFSFLDQLAGQSQIKERVNYMRPSKIEQKNSAFKLSRVEMKLEAVTLEQLTTFLAGVETSRNAAVVSKISITRRDQKEGLLDAILQVDTLEL
jgi:general secretion pathway protein M